MQQTATSSASLERMSTLFDIFSAQSVLLEGTALGLAQSCPHGAANDHVILRKSSNPLCDRVNS